MRRSRQLLAIRRYARPERSLAGVDVPDVLDWAAGNLAAMATRMREGGLGLS